MIYRRWTDTDHRENKVKFLKLERSWGDREPGTVSGPRSNVAIDEKPISSMGIDTIRHHINGNTELLYALDHEYLGSN